MSRGRKRTFTYEEALESFPRVRKRTAAAVSQVESLVNQVRSRQEMANRKEELDSAIQAIVQRWAADVAAFGCEVKGLWLVDWDSGDGYYCWRYPEESLSHFHAYDEGFAGRVPIN
jgi:hypothetical protein